MDNENSQSSQSEGPATSADALTSLSALESTHFGVTIARNRCLTRNGLAAANAFCQQQGVHLLIARCPAADLLSVPHLEADGFRLMDTLVYWRRNLATPLPEAGDGITVRPLEPPDVEAVLDIATQAFQRFIGHYHADPRLDPKKCTEAYISLIKRSCCEPGVAGVTLVAHRQAGLLGFIALKKSVERIGETILMGVLPQAKGQGIGRAVVLAAMRWYQEQGCRFLDSPINLVSIQSQKTHTRLGFEVDQSFYTFHKWFDTV